MIRLASRLKTSFNIEHIVSPIHIQISDAIMNFQENGRTISQRVSISNLFMLYTHT